MAKILIVDDSDVLRLELKEALEKGGHNVVEGRDGAHGLSVALENKDIQLVITDLNMPVMDGVGMSEQIHKTPGFEKVPIFMLTTESSADLKVRGKEAGVILWIVKPFNPDKVLAAISKVTGG